MTCLSKLDDVLDAKWGDDWHEWEMETLSLEMGAKFDESTIIKIVILKALQEHPDIVLNDADYFLRFVEAANHGVPDPHHADIPTSLELDYALKELEHILGDRMKKTNMLKNVVNYVVKNEGHGKVASERLAKYGGKEQVMTEFTKAYEMYASEMNRGDS
ncbi:hypothetical protein VPHD181_0304 [Vibrio phage D181]